MRAMTAVAVLAVLLMGASYRPGVHQEFWAYVGESCVALGSETPLTPGGATLGTVVNANFTAGSSCAVLPPPGVPSSIALRCAVSSGAADIFASTPVAATAPAGDWCVEVRTVAPQFIE